MKYLLHLSYIPEGWPRRVNRLAGDTVKQALAEHRTVPEVPGLSVAFERGLERLGQVPEEAFQKAEEDAALQSGKPSYELSITVRHEGQALVTDTAIEFWKDNSETVSIPL